MENHSNLDRIFYDILTIITLNNAQNDFNFQKSLFNSMNSQKYPIINILTKIEIGKWYFSENSSKNNCFSNFNILHENHIFKKDFLMIYLINNYNGIFLNYNLDKFSVIFFQNPANQPINQFLNISNKNLNLIYYGNSLIEALETISTKMIK
jgi:hypothetical protein